MGEAFLLHEPGDDDSRFLVSVARPVEVPAAFQRMTDEDPVVGLFRQLAILHFLFADYVSIDRMKDSG